MDQRSVGDACSISMKSTRLLVYALCRCGFDDLFVDVCKSCLRLPLRHGAWVWKLHQRSSRRLTCFGERGLKFNYEVPVCGLSVAEATRHCARSHAPPTRCWSYLCFGSQSSHRETYVQAAKLICGWSAVVPFVPRQLRKPPETAQTDPSCTHAWYVHVQTSQVASPTSRLVSIR